MERKRRKSTYKKSAINILKIKKENKIEEEQEKKEKKLKEKKKEVPPHKIKAKQNQNIRRTKTILTTKNQLPFP